MSSKVIKFVAGAGKTTFSKKYMKTHKNGLYLAFNKSVVEELENKGLLAKTIDSLFSSFIIPKFTSAIPLTATGAQVKYRVDDERKPWLNGASNIKIYKDGSIYNKGKKITEVTMHTKNEELNTMNKFPNRDSIKRIFSNDALNINDAQRAEISFFIIENYPDNLASIMKHRFSFIIIDEAQDLKGFREAFAHILYKSGIDLILLGDEHQNINGGGKWFEELPAAHIENKSLRCPEKNCEWIRDKLGIDIHGNDKIGGYIEINLSDLPSLDDGKRVLLYDSTRSEKIKNLVKNWSGNKFTIKKSKGDTIKNDIVIIGESLNKKNIYTAVTRTTQFAYSTIKKIND